MRILKVHNFYQRRGGEDESFRGEVDVLKRHGHEVPVYTVHNDQITGTGLNGLRAAVRATWNPATYHKLRGMIRQSECTVCHFHNTFPLVSPSAYYAAQAEGAAVVQTVSNYRFVCPAATFLRDGRICEDCSGKLIPWPSVVHGCYRQSRMASCAVAGMLTYHRLRRSLAGKVDSFIALTPFQKAKLVENGFPTERIHVKPEILIQSPEIGEGSSSTVLYVGRISREKSVETLLEAWRAVPAPRKLSIVGDGPVRRELQDRYEAVERVEWFGELPSETVYRMMGQAEVLVVPSRWYEPFGRVVIEAFAAGLPVLASGIGGLKDLVSPGETGFLFEPGNTEDLAAQLLRMLSRPDLLKRMRHAARAEFEAKYTAESNYEMLMAIYERTLEQRRRQAPARQQLVCEQNQKF